ncbi:hypothetical protein K402DRAFT_398930 [Aulographum hederae CBS 113979]|uniref:Zn(2)-C6 fungal-type domain-containing protein n=1 Tax=Aulographum hederae CBS 113979 TaxID=1176131 RepID=A0A6G1GJR1_9PEZI|nr:hypothetical protein K402DRAFT_398930 [Aulographum hederae CBS 113979]
MSSSPVEAQRVRRNGKLEACEPCRKSKLRCDHAHPVCGRCRLRNTASRCVYHPAPLTRPRDTIHRWHVTTAQLPGPRPLPTAPIPSPDSRNSPRTSTTTTTPDASHSTNSRSRKTPENQAHNPGFLGPSSFSAAFDGDQVMSGDDPNTRWPGYSDASAPMTPAVTVYDAARVKLGGQMLALLPEFSFVEEMIERYFQLSTVVIIPLQAIKVTIQTLRSIHKSRLSTEARREELAEYLFRQSDKPIQTNPSMTPEEFYGLFTGENLRWEIIGVLFALIGCSTMTHPSLLSLLKDSRVDTNWTSFTEDMLLASNVCISFCQDSFNDLLLWMMHSNLTLLTMHRGESSHAVWRRLSDLASTIFGIGYHQENRVTDQAPTFLIELRKRSFAGAYAADISIATFLGRPPRIADHYASTSLPLDLPNEILMVNHELLDDAISKLDPQGWNTDNAIHRATFLRARTMISKVREEVLHLYLGNPIPDLEAQVHKVLQKADQVWNSVPPFVRYSESYWDSGIAAHKIYMLLQLHLEHLYSKVLLYRLIVKYGGGAGGTDLLNATCRDIVSGVLVLYRERDRLLSHARDFPWVILYYGLPCAAILAIELRRQQRGQSNSAPLPRAHSIRDLTLFTSNLESISRSGDGNSPLCAHAYRALGQILDELLEERTGLNQAQTQGQAEPSNVELGPSAVNSAMGMGGIMPQISGLAGGAGPGQDGTFDLSADGLMNSENFLDGLIDMNWDLSDWTMTL